MKIPMCASITSATDGARRTLAAAVIALDVVLHAAAASPPKRLAIYYGYPSLVEGAAGDLTRATDAFARYDLIVFGDGLELGETSNDPGLRAEHERLRRLVPLMHATARAPRLYGYIDLGRSQQLKDREIVRRIDAWHHLGVDGIFFDEAGNDFGVTTARRSAAIRAAHDCALSVLMNAFNPDDLFDAPGLGANDALLVESFAVREGVVQPRQVVAERVAAALKWRRQTGVKVYAVTTSARGSFDRAAFDYAQTLAVDLGLDGFGWGEPDYSADTKLPYRQ